MYDEKIQRKRVQVFEAMEPLHKIAGEWRDDPDLTRQAVFHLCHVVATQQVLIGALIGKLEVLNEETPPALLETQYPTFPGHMDTPFGPKTWQEMRVAGAWDETGALKPEWRMPPPPPATPLPADWTPPDPPNAPDSPSTN